MDEFDYSVQISDLDWDSFILECEECDLLPPALASSDGSGVSDVEDVDSPPTQEDIHSDFAFDGPPDFEDSLVDSYISVGNPRGPEDVLSGSEEDAPLEVVNRFFERLKSLASEEENTGSSTNTEATSSKQRMVGPVENYSVSYSETMHSLESLSGQGAKQSEGGKEIMNPQNLPSKGGKEAHLSILKETEGSKPEIEPSRNADSSLMLGMREGWPEGEKMCNCDNKLRLGETNESKNPFLKTPFSSEKEPQANMELSRIRDTCTTAENLSIKSPRVDEENSLMTPQSEESAAEVARSTSKADLNLYAVTEVKQSFLKGFLSKDEVTKINQNGDVCNAKMRPACQKVAGTGGSTITEFSLSAGLSVADMHSIEGPLCNKIISQLCQNGEKHGKVDQESVCTTYTLPTEDNLSSRREHTSTKPEEMSQKAILESFELLSLSSASPKNVKYFTEKDGEGQEMDRGEVSTPESGKVQSNSENQSRSDSGILLEIADVSKGLLSSDYNSLRGGNKLFKDRMQSNFQQSNKDFSEGSTEFCYAAMSDSIASFGAEASTLVALSNTTATFHHPKDQVNVFKHLQKVAISPESECQEAEIGESSSIAFKKIEPSAELHDVFKELISGEGSDRSEVQADIPQQKCIFGDREELENAHLLKKMQKSIMVEPKSGNSPKTLNDSNLTNWEAECNTIHILGNHPDCQSKQEFEEEAANVAIINCFTSADSPESINESFGPGVLLSVENSSQIFIQEKVTPVNARRLNPENNHEQRCPSQNQPLVSACEVNRESCKLSERGTAQERDEDPAPELNMDRCTEQKSILHSEEVHGQKEVKEEMGDVLESSRPVYAISCFWDEMEKLTINDILQLRLVGNAQSPGLPSDLQDDTMTHASGAADSGFFNQLEDSKPSRSSGNISTLSDFEEEFSPTDNLSETDSPEPQVFKSQSQGSLDSNKSQDVLWESGMDPMLDLEDGLVTLSNNACEQSMLLANPQKYVRRMHKNISMKNLTGLEIECHKSLGSGAPSLKATTMEEEEPENMMTEDAVPKSVKSNPMTEPSFSRIANENSTVSFPEMFEYFFLEDETEERSLDKRSLNDFPSYGDSVPETYDYFFLEFEPENFFLPMIQSGGAADDKPVPIFSPSSSGSSGLQFSKEYDFFFPAESPVVSDDDEIGEPAPVRIVTRSEHTAPKSAMIASERDMYEDFFSDRDCNENLFWKNPFSLRHLRLPGLRELRKSSTSHKEKSQTENSRQQGRTHAPPHVYQLETWVFRTMEALQQRHANLQTALISPRRDIPYLSIRQSDMCLICIAFASWVLRSANPQALDAWKAALLANISALSAIRYLRRYIREEAAKEKL